MLDSSLRKNDLESRSESLRGGSRIFVDIKGAPLRNGETELWDKVDKKRKASSQEGGGGGGEEEEELID